jgi:hypothetical protein
LRKPLVIYIRELSKNHVIKSKHLQADRPHTAVTTVPLFITKASQMRRAAGSELEFTARSPEPDSVVIRH